MKPKSLPHKSRPGIWIAVLISPFFILLAFIIWRSTHLKEERARYRTERAALERRVADVIAAVQVSGATAKLAPSGAVEITVPAGMVMTDSQAADLAALARTRTGSTVRIKSFAGELISSSP